MAAMLDLSNTLASNRLLGFAPVTRILVAAPQPAATPGPATAISKPATTTLAGTTSTTYRGSWITTSPAAVQAFMNDWGLSSYWNPNDPLLQTYDQLVAQYANKTSQVATPGRDNATMIYAALMSRQLMARHKTNGDCGQQTSLSMPGIATASKIGSSIVGTGVGTASAISAIGSLGWAPAIGLAAGIASLALLPIGIFAALAAHHAQAVATEQNVDCDTVNFFNSYSQTVVQAVKANTVDWKAAKAYFDAILTQSLGAWQKTSQASPCNAGCMYQNAAKALHDLFVMLYGTPPVSQPVQAAPLAPPVSPLLQYGITTGPVTESFGLVISPATTPAASAAAAKTLQAAQTPGPSAVNAQGGAVAPPSGPLSPVLAIGAGAAGLHFLGAF